MPQTTASRLDHEPASDCAAESGSELRRLIEHAAHLLPSQGPITVFVHHNTLHSFEQLPFEEALRQGAAMYGCHPYLPEERYREELARGRIQAADLEAVLADDLDDSADEIVAIRASRYQVRLAMLLYPQLRAPEAELRWLMAETDTLVKTSPEIPAHVRQRMIEETRHWVMRDLRSPEADRSGGEDRRIRVKLDDLFDEFGRDAIERWSDAIWEAFCLNSLWRVCEQGVHGLPRPGEAFHAVRHRDFLFAATGHDSDRRVNDLLIRFCGAFLDQGVSVWSLPHRDEGFFAAFSKLYRVPGAPTERWLRDLPAELDRLEQSGISPLESIEESLLLLGVGPAETGDFLTATLLALRGWGGMLWQMETNAEWTIRPAPRGTLIEFLAARLLLDRLALAAVGRETLGFHGPLSELRKAARAAMVKSDSGIAEQRAFLVFQLAQGLGWTPQSLFRLSKPQWSTLVTEIEEFNGYERRRIYHRAYERRYLKQSLDAVAIAARRPLPTPPTPTFQFITCIDDREESLRRHLEELDPRCETFSAAGFFSAAMYYRGAADAHFIPLCPIIMKPQHYVQEEVAFTFEEAHHRRARTRRALGTASHWFHTGSRSFLSGVMTSLVGSLASFPLVARILFPHTTARIRSLFGQFVQPPPATRLRLERFGSAPAPTHEGLGYTVNEMAAIITRLLQDLGLTKHFSRMIIFAGHGSSSLNNPHESAYNCGACGGGRGGPNARAIAQMANDPRVRNLLFKNGLEIPADTVFVGCYHNTCSDRITWFDLDRIPASHRADYEAARRTIDLARERNAHERCRRFESAPLSMTPEGALRHVEERAEDLSQARPEYNHATNALCIVARRARTRGLFLDRRAFLNSYDPEQDPNGAILARILAAAIPVCAGISLEYYFSTVDTASLGCGSKLPHNVASLLGVMEGAQTDLRTGLSQQMIEIHEPVRLVVVVEAKPEVMLKIMDDNPVIGVHYRNDWVYIATLDPESNRIQLFRNGKFEPYRPELKELPRVMSSLEWYRGWRDHLGFAMIGGGDSNGKAPTARVLSNSTETVTA